MSTPTSDNKKVSFATNVIRMSVDALSDVDWMSDLDSYTFRCIREDLLKDKKDKCDAKTEPDGSAREEKKNQD